MKYCYKCGSTIDDGDAFCVFCGSQQGSDYTVPVSKESCQTTTVSNQEPGTADYIELIWIIVSFFQFWVGIIYFLLNRERKPQSAKYCLIGSLANLGISVIVFIVMLCVGIGYAM